MAREPVGSKYLICIVCGNLNPMPINNTRFSRLPVSSLDTAYKLIEPKSRCTWLPHFLQLFLQSNILLLKFLDKQKTSKFKFIHFKIFSVTQFHLTATVLTVSLLSSRNGLFPTFC